MQKLKFLNFYKYEKIIGPIAGLILIWLSTYTAPTVGLFLTVPMVYHIYSGFLLHIKSDEFMKHRMISDITGIIFGLLYGGYGILSTFITINLIRQIETIRFTHIILCALPAFIGIIGIVSAVYNAYSIYYFKNNKKEIVKFLHTLY